MKTAEIRKRLRELADQEKAKILRGFFKTGPGEYGEGDAFLGITVPVLRRIAKECRGTVLCDALELLKSDIHEERLLALFLLISAYSKGEQAEKKKIFSSYLKHTRYVNNWDLVDLSAPKIVGVHLADKPRQPLYRLARSRQLWERRIAIVATFHFIRQNDIEDALALSTILVNDGHDLIQKAVGWMLREIGKRDLRAEEQFLLQHYKGMPRTMLRYAIERFPKSLRKRYLNGSV